MAFINQKKAFDRVHREKLWAVLEDYGVHGELLDSIRALYADSKSFVRTDGGNSKWFKVTSGVRQGSVLSPLLFIVYMDHITREANDSETELNELLFADDQSLAHNDKESLQRHVTALDDACEKYGMISIKKAEVMSIGRERKCLNMEIKGQGLNHVKEFKYLGSMFTEGGKIDK